jgi:hypothetical protein
MEYIINVDNPKRIREDDMRLGQVLSNYLLSTPKDLFYMEDMELLKILF